METDRYNREKNSHVMQQRGDGASGVSIKDNRQKGSRNYLPGAPLQRMDASAKGKNALQRKPTSVPAKQGHESGVAQRVIQRKGEAKNCFKYITNITRYKSRLPYTPGLIDFTNYQNVELLSAGFNGCFMMAFHFSPKAQAYFREIIVDYNPISAPPVGSTLIGHISNDRDGKQAFLDALERGLIVVEAMFRPYRNAVIERDNIPTAWSDDLFPTAAQATIGSFTAGMEKIGGSWTGKVYNQEKIIRRGDHILDASGAVTNITVEQAIRAGTMTHNQAVARGHYDWQISHLRDISAAEMPMQTSAAEAFICAWIIANGNSKDLKKKASARLKKIRRADRGAIDFAETQLVNPEHEADFADILDPETEGCCVIV